jgi:tetratricopeptide (TPR) repeat protein
MASTRQWTKDADSEALHLFYRAIELDPDLASAYGMAAWCYVRRKASGWMIDRAQESMEATRLARSAVYLGKGDPVALCMGGYALAFVAHEFDDAAAFMDQGLAVNPNLATAWSLSAWLRVWRGEPNLALEHVAHAMRLSPLDPSVFGMQGATAYAHFLARRYDCAWSWAAKAIRENPNFMLALCAFAASSALAGQLGQARRIMARIEKTDPNLRVSYLRDLTPFRRSKDIAAFAKALRKAGLPE